MVVPMNWPRIETVAASETIETRKLLLIFSAIAGNIISLHFARQPAYDRYKPYRRDSRSTIEIERMSRRQPAAASDNRIAVPIGIENIISASSTLAIPVSLLLYYEKRVQPMEFRPHLPHVDPWRLCV